jgi:WD40 repeat protein
MGLKGGYGVTFRPDGDILAAVCKSGLYLADASTGRIQLRRTAPTSDLMSVAFTAGKQLATINSAGILQFWRASPPQVGETVAGRASGNFAAAVSPDGSLIAAGSWGGQVSIWDSRTRQPLQCLRIQRGQVWKVRFTPDGRRLVSRDESGVLVWDLQQGQAVYELKAESSPQGLAVSDDGTMLAIANSSGSVQLHHLENGTIIRTLAASHKIYEITFDPNGRYVSASDTWGPMTIWRVDTGDRLQLPGQGASGGGVLFDPQGERFFARFYEACALFDMGSGERFVSFEEPGMGSLTSQAFNISGDRVITGHGDGSVRIWDSQTGDRLLTLLGHSHPLCGIAVSPDNDLFVTASTDIASSVRLWGDTRPRARPGESVNLLKLVDPKIDSVQGEWQTDGESLRAVSAQQFDRLVVPLTPQGGYVLRCEFTRVRVRSGGSKILGFLLPAGAGRTALCLHHERRATSGLELINRLGVGDPSNPTNVTPGTLEDGRQYAMEARVTLHEDDVTVDVTLDGKPYIHWQGPQRSLTIWPGWEVAAGGNVLGLATGHAEVVFHRLELEMLDGEAVYLRSPPPKPPAGAVVVPAGQAINLLEQVDPKVDAFDVTIEVADPGLRLSAEKFGRVNLPLWPQGSYELNGSFTLPALAVPTLLVPVQTSRGLLVWRHPSPDCSGFSAIRGMPTDDPQNPTLVKPSRIQFGRRHSFRVRVLRLGENADIVVELDGSPYFHWQGPEADVSMWPNWDIPHQRTLGIGVEKGSVTYHELTLKMLDGEAWLLRPKP